MPMRLLPILATLTALALVSCKDSGAAEDGADPGTTGGETATSPLETETGTETGTGTGAGAGTGTGSPSCETTHCDPGTTCVMVEVQCIRAPCPPQPACVSVNSTCAVTLCMTGTRCVESTTGARCEPIR